MCTRWALQQAQYSFATAIGLFNSVCNFILLVIVNFAARKFSSISVFCEGGALWIGSKKAGPIRQSAGDRLQYRKRYCYDADYAGNRIPALLRAAGLDYRPGGGQLRKLLLYPEAPYFEGYTRAALCAAVDRLRQHAEVHACGHGGRAVLHNPRRATPLSRIDLPGRRVLMFLFTFTMFFSGGIIPLYLVVRQLHMYDTIWAIVLPVAVSAYNLIVCRSFFDTGIPNELLEAAKIDGCNDFKFFFRIVLPLPSTIIAVMCLSMPPRFGTCSSTP